MNFFDFVFFIKVCEFGIFATMREFSLNKSECDDIISSLQIFLNDPVFLDLQNPSLENLTEKAKIFFPGAKKIVSDLFSDFMKRSENNKNNNIVKIKSDILSGKNIILPSIARLESDKKHLDTNIELFTCEEHERLDSMNMHIIFHDMEKADKIFFERKWSLKIGQGLYSSKNYLHEARNIPEMPEDLLNHAIIGSGDSFDQEIYSYTNWHLSPKYMGLEITPAIMINSRSVLIAAIEANLGIGPVIEYHNIIQNENLCKILPEIKAPPITIDFAVRKNLNESYESCVKDIEKEVLLEIKSLGLEIVY